MKRLLAVLGAVAILAGACGGDDNNDTQTQGGQEKPAAAPSDFTVSGTEYAYDGPSEISGGVVTMTFENKGKLKHEAVLLGIGDTSVDQAVKDFAQVPQGGPIPAYMSAAGGIGEVDPGQSGTSTISVPEGNYLFICALTDGDSIEGGPPEGAELPPHSSNGMVRAVTVTGDNGRSLPAADGTITARDYSFDIPAITAGPKTMVFRNEGPEQFHHLVMMEFAEGVDEAGAAQMWEALANAGPDSPPPAGPEPEDVAGTSVFGPGTGGTFDVEFKAGRTYAALCFISDKAGGPPHAFAHQMVKFFTVS